MEESDPIRDTVLLLTVEALAEGQRLDVWLAEQFSDLSRSVLKKYIQEGRITIEGTVSKPGAAVRESQRVEVRLPPPASPLPIPQDHPLDILHEDEALIVINKAPDMVVHPGPGNKKGGTLVNALLGHTDTLSSEGGMAAGARPTALPC